MPSLCAKDHLWQVLWFTCSLLMLLLPLLPRPTGPVIVIPGRSLFDDSSMNWLWRPSLGRRLINRGLKTLLMESGGSPPKVEWGGGAGKNAF